MEDLSNSISCQPKSPPAQAGILAELVYHSGSPQLLFKASLISAQWRQTVAESSIPLDLASRKASS